MSSGRGGLRTVIALSVSLFTIALVAACVPAPPPVMTIDRPAVAYRVLGGIEQIYVLGAAPGAKISVSAPGKKTQSGVADRLGSLAIRELEQGTTYKVTNEASKDSRNVTVLRATDNPPQSFYSSTKMKEGLNYIPMRDGITLAATVRPPLGQSLSDGPFPTVIEYSGYQIAAPHEPLEAKLRALLKLPEDPLAPASSTDVGGLLVRLAGFAVVSVQIRGSGCSGGESDLFDLPTRYDGYDAIETVAAQKWAKNGTVGMVGISFSGFSQIAVASTNPPHLSAIAPMSFVGSLYDLAHPGGIYNNGFANTWLAEREANAKPAPDPGALPYANYMVHTDTNCRYNQLMRLQTRNGVSMTKDADLVDSLYTRRDFRPWMGQIKVPTFASLQFNDEETG
ncbi:MAG TPA: CocE/NonD family hydrolase, partial [Microthrixaceae bacterium]|nr:CocE/NonD family hydrolase [Microthrixaceae bacterium]